MFVFFYFGVNCLFKGEGLTKTEAVGFPDTSTGIHMDSMFSAQLDEMENRASGREQRELLSAAAAAV